MIAADPAIHTMLCDQLPRTPEEMTAEIITALAGPHPDHAAVIRARAAIAVIKEGTLSVLQATSQHLTPADREQILAAALRALKP